MKHNPSPLAALCLGAFLLGIGFVVGFGYRSRATQQASVAPIALPVPVRTQAPLVKALRASPDGKLVAFTGIYGGSTRAGVWLFDVERKRAGFSPSPAGWQDYVAQWRPDGRALLLEREKIPPATAEAQAGIYEAPLDQVKLETREMRPRTPDLPPGEKLITGFLAPDGTLLVKTRREPKRLFVAQRNSVHDNSVQPIDAAPNTYRQNRIVRRNGKNVLLAVRDAPNSQGAVALFRVENGKTKRLSPFWDDIKWSYVAPSGRQMIVARELGADLEWTLLRIDESAVKTIKTGVVSGDVISVYWSDDEKRVLGAAGEKLWLIDVPSLKYKRLGDRIWNADDATWLGSGQSVAIAANGQLWRVEVPSGQASLLWTFPEQFWK